MFCVLWIWCGCKTDYLQVCAQAQSGWCNWTARLEGNQWGHKEEEDKHTEFSRWCWAHPTVLRSCVFIKSMAHFWLLIWSDYWSGLLTEKYFYFSCLLPHFQISSQKLLQNKDNSNNIFCHCNLNNTLLQIQMQFYRSTVVQSQKPLKIHLSTKLGFLWCFSQGKHAPYNMAARVIRSTSRLHHHVIN